MNELEELLSIWIHWYVGHMFPAITFSSYLALFESGPYKRLSIAFVKCVQAIPRLHHIYVVRLRSAVSPALLTLQTLVRTGVVFTSRGSRV